MFSLIQWLTAHSHYRTHSHTHSHILSDVSRSPSTKKGSSLLLVVLTMSVIIVISSSFMLLSFNSGVSSIFASAQHKAQLSCLSVANGLKDGNTFGSIVNQYTAELSSNQVVEFNVNDNSLDGTTTVKLEPSTSGGSVKSVKVVVTTMVGKSKYEVQFTHTMKTDSIRDVINQVTNSMSVSGGGSFSMQTGKVSGDLSLDGDYLLALNTWKEINDKSDGQTGWAIYPGTVNGNVYCNGSLVIGYKGNSVQIYKEETIGTSATRSTTAIPTIITQNLYVNGDLIINACEIHGDVYVSGNVLVNGWTDTMRGTEKDQGDGKYYTNANNAIINGNLYVGGSLYVTSGSFSRYFPEKEKVVNDTGSAVETEGYAFSTFPTFPSAAEIYGNDSSSDYSNVWANLFGLTINSKKTSNGQYVYTYNNGMEQTLDKSFVDYCKDALGMTGETNKIINDEKSTKMSISWHSNANNKNGRNVILVTGYDCLRWYKGTFSSSYKDETGWEKRAYSALFQVLTGNHWSNEGESSLAQDSSNTIRNIYIKNYEKYKLTASYGIWNNEIASFAEQTFTVSQNAIVQGNAYVQFSNKKIGSSTYILGDLDTYSAQSICTSDGGTVSGVTTAFNNLYVGGTTTNRVYYAQQIISPYENYYSAYMSFCADGGKKTASVKKGDNLYGTGNWWKFYYYDGSNYNSTNFVISGNEASYNNTGAIKTQNFKSEHIAHGSADDSEATFVTGIMAYGSNAMWGRTENTVTGLKGSTGRSTFDSVQVSNKKMYSDDFLSNHNSSAALRTEQKRTESVNTVADVLKEMGVYGYTAGEVTNKNYQNAYQGGAVDKYYYRNLDKTGGSVEYKQGDNKINDRNGVNFTGVTAATQVKFGYTLQKAINAKNNGAITVTSKGSIQHPSSTSGSATGADGWDTRVLYNDGYAYSKGGIGKQNIEGLTKYWIYGQGNIGDTFYGRLLFLGCYDYNMFRANNYSSFDRSKSEEKRQAAFERDVKEVMSYLYNPSLAGADSWMWEQYGKEYAGVIAYDGAGNLCIYIMRDIYLGGDEYYGFGKDTASDDVDGAGFRMYLDTSYHSVNVYWGSDENGMLNYDSDSYIEISILFPQEGSFNVAYMYLLPNIAWSNNQSTGYTVMLYQDLVNNMVDIVNATQVQGLTVDGQNVFKGASGKYYRYSVKSYAEANTGSSDKPLSSSDPALNNKFTFIVRMWNNCKIKNTAVRYSDGSLKAAGIPFVMCEGPLLFMMGSNGEMSGIIYAPNPDSVFFCASENSLGTQASDPSTTFSGGAIVAGRVIGTRHNNANWSFFEDSDKYDIGKLLTGALIEDPNGIGDIDTSGGTNTSGNWSAGDFE